MTRSQAGPGAGTALSFVPTGFLTQIQLPISFKLSSCVASPCRCLCLRTLANVAAQSTRSATTVLREGGSHSKAPLLAFAEKRVVVLGLIA